MSLPSFHYTIDSQGERVYDNSGVQLVYVNLGRLSDFIGNAQVKSELEYTNICQNVSADGNTDTTLSFLVNLLVDAFGFMGDMEFPWAGKAGGKLAGWLLSALVQTWQAAPPPSLQSDFNNVWNGIKQGYVEAILAVDGWREGLNPTTGADIWAAPHICPVTKETVTVSQLADIGYLPERATTEFELGAIAIANKSRYLMNRILVPSRWKYDADGEDVWWDCYYTRWNDQYPYNGPFNDGLSVQTLFGITTSFPDTDVVDAQENDAHYRYFSEEDAEEYDHNWFSDDRFYKGTRYRRWNLKNTADGGTAPDSLIQYLFKDGPGGDSVNGIAFRSDVFGTWGMH